MDHIAVPVLGGRITPFNLNRAVEFVLNMIRTQRRGYVCIANVHTTTMAVRDKRLRKALHDATAVFADGMPVVWRIRAAGYPEAGRVYGADLVRAVCASGITAGVRHGFFGGEEGVADAMITRLRNYDPGIEVAGTWNPGSIREGDMSRPELVDAINRSRCDILWVGLGAPKQELWMSQHRPYLITPLLIGVGQAFDLLAGRRPEPPDWISRNGLEWAFRLAHEPRRLWKRYLCYNSLFLWYLLVERYRSGTRMIGE